jgi:hypothetical protein
MLDCSEPELNTRKRGPSLQDKTRDKERAKSKDKIHEPPKPGATVPEDQNDEASSPSYLVFEPVVSTVSEKEPMDWRRYEPPKELLNSQDDTSEVVRGILEPSIARIRARHVEEEGRQVANARRERPLSRVGRASVKPRREVSTSNGTMQDILTNVRRE